MSNASIRHQPRPGDVIIRKDRDHDDRYVLGTVEHRAELAYATFSAATAQGTAYALAHGVCLWQADERDLLHLVLPSPMLAQATPPDYESRPTSAGRK